MRKLTVENFSCIKKAEVNFSRLTVFIGPQASGKSVLCKLAYFFLDAAHQQAESLLKLTSYNDFCNQVRIRFSEWFPSAAWGKNKFKIEFFCGSFSVSITRGTYRKVVSDNLRLKFSDDFKDQYERLLVELQEAKGKPPKSNAPTDFDWHFDWKFREGSQSSLSKLMGSNYIPAQFFVPAGRSFFTSIGKAIAAFEHGRVLDPLILRFGRVYTAYKNEGQHFYREDGSDSSLRHHLTSSLNKIFGGNLKFDGEREYVVTDDGREIPLSALSSGQQELLPLVAVFPHLIMNSNGLLCYVEEPEAHLFPTAQSKLIESMVSLLGKNGTDLVITTHSPYVLTKINNLMKAGQLGRRSVLSPEDRKMLETIVPRRARLSSRSVAAYAIKDGVVQNIIGNDQFIDADYLDEVSGELGNEFNELLEIESHYV